MVIDQSGRVEETQHHTVVALADKNRGFSIMIPSKVKKELLIKITKKRTKHYPPKILKGLLI